MVTTFDFSSLQLGVLNLQSMLNAVTSYSGDVLDLMQPPRRMPTVKPKACAGLITALAPAAYIGVQHMETALMPKPAALASLEKMGYGVQHDVERWSADAEVNGITIFVHGDYKCTWLNVTKDRWVITVLFDTVNRWPLIRPGTAPAEFVDAVRMSLPVKCQWF